MKQRVHPFFAETNPLEHRNLRRRISKAYSMSYILAMENYIDPSSLSSVTYVNFAPITILSSQEQKKCILAAARIGIAVTFSPISKTLKSSMVSFSQSERFSSNLRMSSELAQILQLSQFVQLSALFALPLECKSDYRKKSISRQPSVSFLRTPNMRKHRTFPTSRL